MYKIGYII